MAEFDDESIDGEEGDAKVCSECGGKMTEDDGDSEMSQCEKCGHTASSEAKEVVDDEEIA